MDFIAEMIADSEISELVVVEGEMLDWDLEMMFDFLAAIFEVEEDEEDDELEVLVGDYGYHYCPMHG